jgi:hypothetical protein
MRTPSLKAAKRMRTFSVPSLVLATVGAFGSLLFAQAPDTALPPGDAARGKSIFESS